MRARSVATGGLDLVKHVFPICAADADGKIVIATALRRRDVLSFFDALLPCVMGLAACGSVHHCPENWSNSVATSD